MASRRSDWTLRGLPLLRVASNARIEIGERFVAVSKSRYNSLGVFQPVMLFACEPDSVIEIGDDVGMSGCSISARERVTIGDRVMVGSGVLITDSDAHPIDPDMRAAYDDSIATKPVEIGDDVFIGARAIILKGVHIGDAAVIGAGAVVSRDIPSRSIAAGNPAEVVAEVPASG